MLSTPHTLNTHHATHLTGPPRITPLTLRNQVDVLSEPEQKISKKDSVMAAVEGGGGPKAKPNSQQRAQVAAALEEAGVRPVADSDGAPKPHAASRKPGEKKVNKFGRSFGVD